MFYFDPFGTTAQENLLNFDIDKSHEHNYICFFDQEPINLEQHYSTLQALCTRGKTTTNKKPILVTSERDSQFVDQVCKSFNFESRYYFFHGWAALDWFRGYNRTFLNINQPNKKVSKTFINPNRIIGGARWHRLLMMYHIIKNGLQHNNISFPERCPVENISVLDLAQQFEEKCPGITEMSKNIDLFNRNFASEQGHPMRSYELDLFDESDQSLVYLVTETVFDGQRLHLTEKTFKPIALGMPFILVAPPHSLQYLRSYGFKSFSNYWDESYDLESDPFIRLEKIAKVLGDLDRLSSVQKNDLWQEVQPIVNHNYNHFYNGNFERVLWTELTEMLDGI